MTMQTPPCHTALGGDLRGSVVFWLKLHQVKTFCRVLGLQRGSGEKE